MSDSYDYDLVCIGSGPAGQRAAVQAAKLGHRAAVVEKRRAVRGVCIDTGTIPSKTLRESIEVADGPSRKAVLHLESGKRIVTDMVLYSAGRIAATDALNLLNAGIAAAERGRLTLAECYKVAALDASNKLRY